MKHKRNRIGFCKSCRRRNVYLFLDGKCGGCRSGNLKRDWFIFESWLKKTSKEVGKEFNLSAARVQQIVSDLKVYTNDDQYRRLMNASMDKKKARILKAINIRK